MATEKLNINDMSVDSTFVIEKDRNKNDGRDVFEIKLYLWRCVLFAIIIGVAMILLMTLFRFKTLTAGITAFGSGVLIAGGSILCGSFLGFIFGIPSILQDPETRFKYNDNLVQVSDWLTKIIVGVGLTQLYQIPHFVKQLGIAFSSNFSFTDTVVSHTARNVAIAIMGYYFILGFIMIYFWAKTDYSTVINYMDDAFNKKLRVAKRQTNEALKLVENATQGQQEAEVKLQLEKQEKDEIKTQVIKEKTQEVIKQSNYAGDNNSVDELQKSSNPDIKQKLDALQAKVTNILPTKTITTVDDIQKDRWGGKSEDNGKRISATVKRNTLKSLFEVTIAVVNTDGSKIDVPVAIFVHDSYGFPDNVVYVSPNSQGVDELQLFAYEGFTVGALFADGTELELDLDNKELDYPIDFYSE